MIKKVTAALSERVDRWTDIGLRRMSLLTAVIVVIAMVLSGCEEGCVCHCKDSYSGGLASVKVNILWDERFQETPTGVTILAYASNGCLYNSFRSNKTDYAQLFLPEGEFTLVAFNQSLNELLPIWFSGYEKFENTRITVSEMETPPSWILDNDNLDNDNLDNDVTETENKGIENASDEPLKSNTTKSKTDETTSVYDISETLTEPLIQSAPWFALSSPVKVTIGEEEMMGLNTRCKCKVCCCSHLHQTASTQHTLTMKMIPQTYTLKVNLLIHNLPSLASVKAYVSSLQRTIDLRGENIQDRASTLLEQWQKRMTTQTDGVISSMTNCLSRAVTEESALVIELLLTDGKTKLVKVIPLSGKVKEDPKRMTITADVELVESLPKVEGETAGAFWVTVTDWGDPTDIDI